MTKVADFFIDKSMRLIARYLAAGKLQTIASGMGNLPARGPALIVARHYHHLFDGLTLFAAIQRRFYIVVTMDWVQNRRTKFFMQSVNRLARWPMLLRADALNHSGNDRRRLFALNDVSRYQRRALREAVELLVEGRIVVVFPEGYPNIDPTYTPKTEPDQFLAFKPGFLNILRAAENRLDTKIPVIPAGLRYKPGKVWIGYLTFGKPFYRDSDLKREGFIEGLETEVKRLCELKTNEESAMRSEK